MSDVITIVIGNDWDAIYVNGNLHIQGSKFTILDLIRLGLEMDISTLVETVFANENWIDYIGNYPATLKEVVLRDQEFEWPEEMKNRK